MDKNYSDWYELHYHEMTGNGVWFRGDELNTLKSTEYVNRSFRVLITRLSTYWDTADSFTHKLLYQLITDHHDIYADLAYLPTLTDAALFDADTVPWLTGTSSKRDAMQFDVLAFSNSIVQEILNIPTLLQKSGIPLNKKDRIDNNDVPLIILGGANALYTSALQTENPMVDGIFVGEDAGLIKKLFRIAYESKLANVSKADTLEKLEAIDGFFQPDKRKPTKKHTSVVIDSDLILKNAPVMYTEEQLGIGNLQISEGCPCFCSFCAESWGRKPYREISANALRHAAATMKSSMGLETIELYSFNFNMHREFYSILLEMTELFSSIGLKSQRFDTIAAEPGLVKHLHAVGKTSITCGLEGISSRLRKYLHKSLEDQDLKHSLSILIRAPIREIKIFLIATGKETEDDFSEFCLLLRYINDVISMAGRRPRIIFSMTPLVRFPYTPLESQDSPEPRVCREIMLQTERFIRSRGFEYRDSADSNDYYISQMLVRAHDSCISDAIFSAVQKYGFVFYKEIPQELITAIESELKAVKHSSQDVLRGLETEYIANRPVTINVKEEFLRKQSQAAIDFEDHGYCLGTSNQSGACFSCGACESAESIRSITALRSSHPTSVEVLKKKVINRKESFSIAIKIYVAHERRGIPRKNIGIAVARAIMLSNSQLVEPFLSYDGSYMTTRFRSQWIYGDDIITLNFHRSAESVVYKWMEEQKSLDEINKHLISWGTVCGIVKSNEPKVELTIESPYKFDVTPYFQKNSVKYMTRKVADNEYSLQFTKDSLKKKVACNFSWKSQPESCYIRVSPLEKFNLDEFLDNSFCLETPQHKYRINVESHIEVAP